MKKTKETKCQKSSNNTVKSSKLSFVYRPFSSILLVLRRLEFLGLYSYLKIQPSLGRRSSSFQGGSSIKRLAKLRITGYFAVVTLLFLSVATIIPIYIEHTPAEAESGTATPSTLTFTSIRNSASVNLNVTSKDGTFATSSNNERAQFSISTNNYTGYTLKLKSAGSITTLNGNATNINTISTTTTKITFENTTSLNNHWGYIPSHYNSQVNTSNSYYPAPTNTNAATIMVTNSANGSTTHPATSDTYTIGLGLRADYTNPSGTYTNNTFILEYVANEVTYSITYDDGDISGVERIPASIQGNINTIMTEQSQSGNTTTYTTNTNTIALTYSPAPERSGYNFVGWCYGALNADGTECNSTSTTPGKLYKDGEGFGIDKTASNIVTLYAVWEKKTIKLTFDANGGSFNGSSATNVLVYSVPEVTSYAQDTKTTSTTTTADGSGALKSDINDDSQYAMRANYYKDLTLNTDDPGPYELTIYYATESVYQDWICVFEGTSYTPGSSDGCTNAAARAPETNTGGTTRGNKIGGPGSNKTAYAAIAAYKISSKTARIYFHSSLDPEMSYGFWAEFKGGGDVLAQNLISGTYIDKPSDRSGYAFLGWATTPNATTPDWTYDASAKVMESTTVYAVWIKVDGTMQDFTCSTLASGETKILSDSRDSGIYHVSKLADGKCWMLDNLALDLTDSTVKANLTSSTTNASDTTLNYLKNGGGSTSDQYATAGVANWTSSYSYSAPLVNMDSKLKVVTITPCNPMNLTPGCGTEDPLTSEVLAGQWKVGGYYNYCAASAGSYCYGNGVSYGTSSGNASEDICPKGWRMPTGNTSGEYQALYAAYSSNYTNFRNALHLPLSGYFYYGSADIQGSHGRFWSSTRNDNDFMYRLYADTSSISPSDIVSRNYGNSVRCVTGS